MSRKWKDLPFVVDSHHATFSMLQRQKAPGVFPALSVYMNCIRWYAEIARGEKESALWRWNIHKSKNTCSNMLTRIPQGADMAAGMAANTKTTDGIGHQATLAATRPLRGKTPERKILTTVFVDIVSSSALVAGRDPEDADHTLLTILNSLVEAVPRYNGMVSQLLGDGFMAVFGAPNALEDHALRACLAAQDMVRSTVEALDLPDFQVRIGISSGDVITHVMTNGVWADYRAVGECVHLAAKLQQRAEPNSAQLSRDTLDLVPVGVAARPMGSLTLAKGAQPVPVFALEGARAIRRTATDLLRSTNAPFLGRRDEVATIFALADRAEAGIPSSLILRGDAGIGKSRLVGEFLRAPRSRGWTVLQWSQMPIRRLGDPDDLEAVAQSLAIQAIGGTVNAAAELAAAAERRAGVLAGDAIRQLLDTPALTPLWAGLDPMERLKWSIDGLVGAVLDLSSPQAVSQRPMLILVEDAHWTRPVMVRLLDALLTALPGSHSRLLLIATTRPPDLRLEDTAPLGWTPPASVRSLDLTVLNRQQVQEFLDHWLGTDWSLAPLKQQVADHSGGVPLYLEEMLRTLEARRAICGSPGSYCLADPSTALNLPPSLQSLLTARMDLMGPEPRRLLLNAAVIGPTFDVGLLRMMEATPRADLHDQLGYLERAGFITRTRLLPNLEYSFNHALMRESAYNTLPISERKALHGRILQALCQRRDHDLPNRLVLMAHHALKAEEWPLAYAYGRRAGQHAEEQSKFESARQNYEASTEALRRLPETKRNVLRMIQLSIALPRVLLPSGATDVQEAINRAKSLSNKHINRRGCAQASSMLASFVWADGRLEEAIGLCREGLSALSNSAERDTQIQLLVRLGGVLIDKGHFDQACKTLEQANILIGDSDLFDRFGLAASAAVTSNSLLSRSFCEMVHYKEARKHAECAINIADQSGHIFSRIFSYVHFAWILLSEGKHDHAYKYFFESKELCKLARSPLWLPLINAGLGYCSAFLYRESESLMFFEESYRCFTRHGRSKSAIHPRLSLPQVQLWHAEALIKMGKPDHALNLIDEAEKNALPASQLALVVDCKLLQASVSNSAVDAPNVFTALIEEAIQIATSLNMKGRLRKANALLQEKAQKHESYASFR
ncbi:AAA family ATPase [Azospirillum griseum]|uniref:Adenylyl cyclase n=1 Tax=Azospirillum griseum TaxID=2496639 RepID=A0A3S0KZV6_9PROT|nr:adenylate/guanylate cyclase domain-containing protein [Azospirillum griseum]RTR22383.1 adenylyl cyclase [Azospirillum griseum]